MKPTDKIFTAHDIAEVVGVNPDDTSRKQDAYCAFNGVHFALVKALNDFGFAEPVAVEFAHGIGFAASTAEKRGTVLIRRSDANAPQDLGGTVWVDLDTHELAMYDTADLPSIANCRVCLAINVASIEAEVLAKLEARVKT